MKLSARNQLKGKVVSIEKGAVNGIVGIELKGGDVITSTISLNSINELGLEVGKEAYAVIKATSVMVGGIRIVRFKPDSMGKVFGFHKY